VFEAAYWQRTFLAALLELPPQHGHHVGVQHHHDVGDELLVVAPLVLRRRRLGLLGLLLGLVPPAPLPGRL